MVRSSLDSYLNLEPKGLHLATPEPSRGDLLPITDSKWYEGSVGINQALYTSDFIFSSEIGPFARVCQASHILGRVVSHRNCRKEEVDHEFVLDEALQLSATLTALDKHLSGPMDEQHVDRTVSIVDVALCTSARLMLYNMYACNHFDGITERLAKESTIQTECIAGLKQIIATRGAVIAWHVIQQGTKDPSTVSPLIIHSLYSVATECQWFIREDYTEGAASSLVLLIKALTLLAQRWRVAGQYFTSHPATLTVYIVLGLTSLQCIIAKYLEILNKSE